MALFAQYAMACTEEALNDAGWNPKSEADLEATVRLPVLCLLCAKNLTSCRVSI